MKATRLLPRAAWLATIVFFCASCGKSGQAIRPEQPSASDTTGRQSIAAVDGPSTPLVVDWRAEQRADLEEAIHDGIAIIAWDAKGLRLLKRCRLAGDYGYLPIQVKKDVVRLESAEDVRANLPLGGAGIAGKIGGGFEKGETLDIAMAMVGKRRTTWSDVKVEDLKGDCDGASHYVRAILIGAFAMRTGTRGKVQAAVEIFGAGAGGASGSSRNVDTMDGRLLDCEKATGEESRPPGQCAAILRLELEPISKSGSRTASSTKQEGGAETHTTPPPPSKSTDTPEGCPPGMVFAAGKCTKPRADMAHVCKPDDAADCEAQCAKNEPVSCNALGALAAHGKDSAGKVDMAKAVTLYDKACGLGSSEGCVNFAAHLILGTGVPKDVPKGMSLLEKGCRSASAAGCGHLAAVYENGMAGITRDIPKALALYTRGCDGGEIEACAAEGFLYSGALGATRNDKLAYNVSRRACFGGIAYACQNAGEYLELGLGVTADGAGALALYERGCALDKGECADIAFQLHLGNGVPKDEARARSLLAAACGPKDQYSIQCVVAHELYATPTPPTATDTRRLNRTVTVMRTQCDQRLSRACTEQGIAEWGLGKKVDAQVHLRMGCDLKDPFACDLSRRLR